MFFCTLSSTIVTCINNCLGHAIGAYCITVVYIIITIVLLSCHPAVFTIKTFAAPGWANPGCLVFFVVLVLFYIIHRPNSTSLRSFKFDRLAVPHSWGIFDKYALPLRFRRVCGMAHFISQSLLEDLLAMYVVCHSYSLAWLPRF